MVWSVTLRDLIGPINEYYCVICWLKATVWAAQGSFHRALAGTGDCERNDGC